MTEWNSKQITIWAHQPDDLLKRISEKCEINPFAIKLFVSESNSQHKDKCAVLRYFHIRTINNALLLFVFSYFVECWFQTNHFPCVRSKYICKHWINFYTGRIFSSGLNAFWHLLKVQKLNNVWFTEEEHFRIQSLFSKLNHDVCQHFKHTMFAFTSIFCMLEKFVQCVFCITLKAFISSLLYHIAVSDVRKSNIVAEMRIEWLLCVCFAIIQRRHTHLVWPYCKSTILTFELKRLSWCMMYCIYNRFDISIFSAFSHHFCPS